MLFIYHTYISAEYYCDVKMTVMASQITSLTIVYSTIYSGADQRKHQNSASLAFVLGIHRGPVNSPHKEPVMWKMFPFDDVIMICYNTVIFLPNTYNKCQQIWQGVWQSMELLLWVWIGILFFFNKISPKFAYLMMTKEWCVYIRNILMIFALHDVILALELFPGATLY